MRKLIAILAALPAVALVACGGAGPAEVLSQGEASLAAHDYRTAMIHALNLIQDDPENVDARLLLGRASLELGDITDAGTQLTLARDGGAPLEAYAVPLAEAHARSGRIGEALSLLDSLPQSFRDPAYFSVYADLLIAQGDVDGAARILEQQPLGATAGEDAAERLAVEARLRSARDDAAGAEAALARALEADSQNPDIWVYGARLAAAAGDTGLAESRLLRGIELYESRVQVAYAAPALLELVRIQLTQSDLDAAQLSVDRLTALQEGSAAASFAQGLIAFEKGELTAAVDSLRRAAIAAPENVEVLRLLGAAYLANGNLGQAEQQLSAAAALAADLPTIRLLAETRLRRGQPDAALSALAQLPADDIVADPGLAALQGVAHLADEDPEAAVAVLERARESAADDTVLTLQLARAYVAAGRIDDAGALVNGSTALSPDATFASNLGLMLNRLQGEGEEAARRFVDEILASGTASAGNELIAGTLAVLTGNRQEADARIAAALDLDPAFVPAYLLTASLELEAGRSREAEAALRQALNIAPGHPAASAALARILAAAGDLNGARAVLGEVPAADAPFEVLALQGSLAVQGGDLASAEALAATLKQRFPLRAAGHSLQGEVESAQGRDAAAATSFASAYELEPGYGTLQNAVNSARRVGNASWKRLLDQRLAESPDDVVARMMLANALLGEGRNPEALVEYREVLERDAGNTTALNNAAWLAHQLGEPGAVDYARSAKALAPGNAAVLDTLGWLLTETDRAADGLAELEEAVRLAPDAPEIRYHLAVAQSRTGRAADARITLESLLRDPDGAAVHDEARALLEAL